MIPESAPDIHFYANPSGQLIPAIAGGFPPIASNQMFYLGAMINRHLYPLFDRNRQWILVRKDNHENVPMTLNLYQEYGHLFRYGQQQIRNHNARNRGNNVPQIHH